MSEELKPTPTDGKCPCGCETLTLATDHTAYVGCEFVEGKWIANGAETEECSDAPDAIRLYCTDCGDYFIVPDSLA